MDEREKMNFILYRARGSNAQTRDEDAAVLVQAAERVYAKWQE